MFDFLTGAKNLNGASAHSPSIQTTFFYDAKKNVFGLVYSPTKELYGSGDLSKVREKTYFPKALAVSPDGNILAISLLSCWHCEAINLGTLLYSIDANRYKFLGLTRDFRFLPNNSFQYDEVINACELGLRKPDDSSEFPYYSCLEKGALRTEFF